MKSARSILALAVASAVVGFSPAFLRADAPVAPTSSQVSPAAAITAAADPSTAIQAYAEARRAEPANTAVDLVYIRKMVEFGLPEMADAQAQALVSQKTTDGLPWAVAAYMSAKREDTAGAMTKIAVAAAAVPGDPFVDRTGAQILAWYDLRVDKTKVAAEVSGAAATTRTLLSEKPEFKQAYTRASEAYALADDKDAAAATAPSEIGPAEAPAQQVAEQPAAVVPVSAYTAPNAFDPGYPMYSAYADPYFYAPISYSYSYPGYVSSWWPCGFNRGPFWWPNFGQIIVINHFRFRHNDGHHHDHDGHFGRGDFDGRRGFAPVRSRDGGEWRRGNNDGAGGGGFGGGATVRTPASPRAPGTPVIGGATARNGAGAAPGSAPMVATASTPATGSTDPARSVNWNNVRPGALPVRQGAGSSTVTSNPVVSNPAAGRASATPSAVRTNPIVPASPSAPSSPILNNPVVTRPVTGSPSAVRSNPVVPATPRTSPIVGNPVVGTPRSPALPSAAPPVIGGGPRISAPAVRNPVVSTPAPALRVNALPRMSAPVTNSPAPRISMPVMSNPSPRISAPVMNNPAPRIAAPRISSPAPRMSSPSFSSPRPSGGASRAGGGGHRK